MSYCEQLLGAEQLLSFVAKHVSLHYSLAMSSFEEEWQLVMAFECKNRCLLYQSGISSNYVLHSGMLTSCAKNVFIVFCFGFV